MKLYRCEFSFPGSKIIIRALIWDESHSAAHDTFRVRVRKSGYEPLGTNITTREVGLPESRLEENRVFSYEVRLK